MRKDLVIAIAAAIVVTAIGLHFYAQNAAREAVHDALSEVAALDGLIYEDVSANILTGTVSLEDVYLHHDGLVDHKIDSIGVIRFDTDDGLDLRIRVNNLQFNLLDVARKYRRIEAADYMVAVGYRDLEVDLDLVLNYSEKEESAHYSLTMTVDDAWQYADSIDLSGIRRSFADSLAEITDGRGGINDAFGEEMLSQALVLLGEAGRIGVDGFSFRYEDRGLLDRLIPMLFIEEGRFVEPVDLEDEWQKIWLATEHRLSRDLQEGLGYSRRKVEDWLDNLDHNSRSFEIRAAMKRPFRVTRMLTEEPADWARQLSFEITE